MFELQKYLFPIQYQQHIYNYILLNKIYRINFVWQYIRKIQLLKIKLDMKVAENLYWSREYVKFPKL